MRKLHKGTFWMVLATFCFAIMGTCVKLGSYDFNTNELVFYRSGINLLIVFFIMMLFKVPLKTNYTVLHLKRSIIGFLSLILFFYAISHLPLGTAMSLNYTSPLFVGLLMPFVLKRRIKFLLLCAIFIGFVGIVLILKPTFADQSFVAGIIGLLSGIGAGFAYLYITQLGQLKEPSLRTVFYFALISTIGSALFAMSEQIRLPNHENIWTLLLLGISATIAQLALTKAYKIGNTLSNAGLSYLTVIFSTIIGVIIFKEYLDWQTYFGICLIIVSGIIASKK